MHLRLKHQVDQDERKGLNEFLRGPGDLSVASLPKDGSLERPDLRVWEGYDPFFFEKLSWRAL